MRIGRASTVLIALLMLSCGNRNYEQVERDLDTISQDTLRVFIATGKLSMETRKRDHSGAEFAILQAYTNTLDIPVLFEQVSDLDSLSVLLRSGEADIIAGSFTADFLDGENLMASNPYHASSIVTAEQRPDPWYGDYWGHRGFPANIETESKKRGKRILSHIHVHHDPVSGKVRKVKKPSELLERVALGHERKVAIPSMMARAYEAYYPHVRYSKEYGRIELVFGLRTTSPELVGSLNSWLNDSETWSLVDALISAYARSRPLRGSFSHPHHKGSHSISGFDDIFKRNASYVGWDWRLLAALAFKESRFDTTAQSHQGASGLMQLMPGTIKEYGGDSLLGTNDEIAIAAKYLATLDRMFRKSVPNKNERIHFVLAAYNAGPGHVFDAQWLARQNKLKSSKWSGHVERAFLLKTRPEYYSLPEVKAGYCNGHHVFLFVREVLHYWDHYRSLGVR